MPSFPSANSTTKQPLFTATALDPNATHYLSITIVNGSAPYSLTNFLVYNPSTISLGNDKQDNSQRHTKSGTKTSSGPNISTIVTAVLASVFFVLLISILFVIWWRRRQRRRLARNRAPSEHTSTWLSCAQLLPCSADTQCFLFVFSVHSHRHGINSSGHSLSFRWFRD